MSSSSPKVAPASADAKPVRRTVTKRAPKASAAEPVPEPVVVASPVAVETAPAATPKKRKAPVKKEKKVAEPVAAATSADNASSTDASSTTDASTSTTDANKEKRSRSSRAINRDFIVAFGDLNTDEKLRLFTKEAFEEWKTLTKTAVEQIRYKEWERAKRDFYRSIKNLQKKKKRVAKGYNWEATAENYFKRLKEMPKEEFAVLDGAWLSNYQFSGKFDAAQLNKEGCPEKGAIPTYTVYQAAVHHGYKPLGIVSENGTRNGETITFTTPVEGRREYVGVALPFQNKERSKFSVQLKDRVQNDL